MAETPVEVVMRARNEAMAAFNQAIGQMKQLEAQTKSASAASGQLRRFRDALEAIVPGATTAVSQVEALARAGGGLGSAGIAAGAVAAGIGLIAAGAISAAKALADTVEQLDNVALVTGTSIGDIQVLSELFKRQGLGADVARAALHKLNTEIGEGNPLLAKLGVTSRDPIEALMQLSAAFATSSDAGLRAKVAQELLGKGGRDLLAVLDTLREAFPELSKEMDETGQKMSPELVKAGRELDTQFEQLAGRWEGQMNRMKEAAGKLLLGVALGGPIFLQYALAQQRAREEADRSTAAWDRYRKSFTPVVDLLKKSTTEQTPLTAAQKAHAAAVQELVGLFGLERAEAERVIDSQERLAQVRRKAALEKELFAPKAIPGIEVKAGRLEGTDRAPTGAEARAQIMADWRALVAEITASSSVLDSSLNALASGLTSGFASVFQNLLVQGQTFGSAMVTVFRSMVNELLAQLARLLAFRLIGLLIGSALPTDALAGAANFTPPMPGLRKGASPTVPGLAAAGAAGGGNTFIIQTLDARDTMAHLMFPGGSLRRAQDRMAAAAAY